MGSGALERERGVGRASFPRPPSRPPQATLAPEWNSKAQKFMHLLAPFFGAEAECRRAGGRAESTAGRDSARAKQTSSSLVCRRRRVTPEGGASFLTVSWFQAAVAGKEREIPSLAHHFLTHVRPNPHIEIRRAHGSWQAAPVVVRGRPSKSMPRDMVLPSLPTDLIVGSQRKKNSKGL